jgi:hypothetical protein
MLLVSHGIAALEGHLGGEALAADERKQLGEILEAALYWARQGAQHPACAAGQRPAL